MRALTGLDYQEFTNLIPVFGASLKEHRLNKRNRRRAIGGGRKGHLKTVEDKLFFILFYIKTYPTFDIMAFFSRKGRGRCCEEAHLYLRILESALGKKITLPKRKIHSVEEFMALFPEVKDIFPDGTERRVQRPKSAKRDTRHYSGKKKSHTRKNVVVSDENKRVLIVSPTKPGRRHDKRLGDRIVLMERIPKDVSIWADSGFQGIQKLHPKTFVTKRAYKNKPLTDEEKAENRVISSFRICSEHAIGGMKRFRAYSDTLRNKIGRFDDRIALVAAALWNYHLAYAD
jgi:hypothetical protein